MALNMRDPYIVREVTPEPLTRLGHMLCAHYGAPADAYGTKGNEFHHSGYHRSRAWILNSPEGSGPNDYSVREARDRRGDQYAVCASDFTPAGWGTPVNRAEMAKITARVRNAALARDPRLAGLREFAGTLNGSTVITFRCSDGAALDPFDSSHLDHFHGSCWRDTVEQLDVQGIFDIITGSTGGADMILASHAGAMVLTDGVTYRWVGGAEYAEVVALFGQPKAVAHVETLGLLVGPTPAVTPPWPGKARLDVPVVVDAEALAVSIVAKMPPGAGQLTRDDVLAAVRDALNGTKLTAA